MAQRTLRRAVSDEDKQQRRDEILAAAKGLFAERGYHDTTIADVARATGLSYGVVYWYFASKDELFHALMATEGDRLRRCIRAVLVDAPVESDEAEVLRLAVRATFDFLADDPASAQLVFHQPRTLGEPFERHLFGIFERFIDDMEALVQRAQAAGQLRAAPSRMVAISCAGLIAQIAMRRTRTDDGMTPEDAADFVVDLLLDGLRPRVVDSASRRTTPTEARPSRRRSPAPAKGIPS
jgi:AcrR family transcriptional regulator